MMQFPVRSIYFKKIELFKMLFGKVGTKTIPIPNMTMEKGESLILHSPNGMETSVAVKVKDDGSLRVLFLPPNVDVRYVDVNRIELTCDEAFFKGLKANKISRIERGKRKK